MKLIQKVLLLAAFTLLCASLLSAQVSPSSGAFSISSTRGNSMNIHFELPSWELEQVEKSGQSGFKIKIADTPYLYIEEEETLPIFSTMVAIPYSGACSFVFTDNGESQQIQSQLSFSSALINEREHNRSSASLYPEQRVKVSEPMILRDYRVVSINVYPFQYDVDSQQIFVNSSMDISLSFHDQPSINEMPQPSRFSPAFESSYEGLILNYDEVRNPFVSSEIPKILVIYGYNSSTVYLNKVEEFCQWKRQNGFLVDSASTNVTGTSSTAIKNYIQGRYDNPATRMDYIVLIGDTSGSMQIPSYSSYIDYYYTWLAGNDQLGDVMIGRISVETADQLINYVAKVKALEQNVNPANSAWLNKMVLVSETYQSGISTIYMNRYIKDISSRLNPNYTYTEEYANSPNNSTINSAINQGVSFYNYRGWIGMGGWPNTMSNLNNREKLFHAVFLTCSTGNFYSGTSTTEQVVRYGTATTLGGAITAIGMATSSTHTPQNNTLNAGIFHGIFNMGARDMGSGMHYGKIYLYAVYGASNPTVAQNFAGYCNLIGDPTATVFTGTPSQFSVEAETSIPQGTIYYPLRITDSAGLPVAKAKVSLVSSTGAQFIGVTDEDGYHVLSLEPTLSGSLFLGVSKADFKTYMGTINIQSSGGLVYNGMVIDDDALPPSNGNGNSVINAGESIELYINIKNTSSSSVNPVANLSCNDPYISLQTTGSINYPSIAVNSNAQNASPFVFSVSNSCPDQHQARLNLQLQSGLNIYNVTVPITIRSPKMSKTAHSFSGATANIVNPGAQHPLSITLSNIGAADIHNLSGILRSLDPFFTVEDSLGAWGSISANMSSTNNQDTFSIHARTTCIKGMIIPMQLYLSNPAGFAQTLEFSFTIGQSGLNDPLGQDEYGYFIFDDSDSGYPQCPVYDWIGIAPAEGGSGTALALTDPGVQSDEGDQLNAVSIQSINLPFPFKFYGMEYSRASISSNGFIVFGDSQNSDWRNGRLPDAAAPGPMIAPFWDDLQFGAGSAVYTYFNASLRYFVVEWHNLLSGYNGSSQETFQVILYDPLIYPTHTQDGQIKIQYKVINNVDYSGGSTTQHGKYATVGIQNHNSNIGLEYTFNNSYPPQAKQLSNNMALFITTRPILPDQAYLGIGQIQVIDPNQNGMLEPGENANLAIGLSNFGLQDAINVSATLSTTDPFVTISQNTSLYGDIPAQENATPSSYFALNISGNCPSEHVINFSLNINAANGNWSYNISQNVFTPMFELNNQHTADVGGNQNGILDPGETATLTIRLQNNGLVSSSAGTATLSSSTPGFTIPNASSSFDPIAPGSFATLSFTVSAAASMQVGTLVQLIFNVSAGFITYQATESLEVGAPLVVVVGHGTTSQTYPLDRYYNYSAFEGTYLASEIDMGGQIKSLAFQKTSGADTSPITPVSIYMKNTTASSLSTGSYNLAEYTQVYNGSFPNSANGWMEVNLNPMFEYDSSSNLSILVLKDYQQWISNYSYYNYTTTTNSRARQNRSDSSMPTSLSASNSLPNIQLRVFPVAQSQTPAPRELSAAPSHQSVLLNWQTPMGANPTSYKIYRNNAFLTNSSTLSYLDNRVTNGITYSYYVTAIYSQGESDPSNNVSATPNALPPSNLVGISQNQSVALSWTAPSGRAQQNEDELFTSSERAIDSYKIYRNGAAIATVNQTNYLDSGLINNVSYSYYVRTIYENPNGQSEPSNTVIVTPNMVSLVELGNGTNVNTGGQNAPLNICNNSVHGQLVYTAAELNAQDITGPLLITGLGFDVVSAPSLPLPNFVVRMKHTNASDASDWQSSTDLITTYTNASYMPTAGEWNMLMFSSPFEWNGTDNILVDTAFSLVNEASQTGTMRYSTQNAGYRFNWSNTEDQSSLFSGGISVARRYNIRFALQALSTGPQISVTPDLIDFGEVFVGDIASRSFAIQNTGDEPLIGEINSPGVFIVEPGFGNLEHSESSRNILNFNIAPAQSVSFNLKFQPNAPVDFSDFLLISSNASNIPEYELEIIASGEVMVIATPIVSIRRNGNRFDLTWESVPRATGYKIYRSNNPYGPFSLLDRTYTNFYQDARPLSYKAFYQVRAFYTK